MKTTLFVMKMFTNALSLDLGCYFIKILFEVSICLTKLLVANKSDFVVSTVPKNGSVVYGGVAQLVRAAES